MNRLSGFGFDAIEMYGEPEKLDIKKLAELLRSYNMPVCGITGMWGAISEEGWKRKLLSANADVQKHAKEYVRECVRMCHLLGGRHLNVCLFADDDNLSVFERTHRTISPERKDYMHDLAVPVLSELAEFAAEHDVRLLLEPLNRYSTPYCRTAHDALNISRRVNNDHFGIMLDTFHMNIEEDSFEHTISIVREVLHHMHFADNNRKMPGYGHIDFKAIVGALIRVGYNKYVTFEPTIGDSGQYEKSLANSLQFIKNMETEAYIRDSA